MIIFRKFEHACQPTNMTKQIKNLWAGHATKCDTLNISYNSNVSYSLSCSKTLEKGSKRLKIPENDHFFQFEHSSLLISITKLIKRQLHVALVSCNSNIIYPLTYLKTYRKEPRRLKTLKNDHFYNFEHSSLPTLLIKQNKSN